jgi:hypothetical protein
MLINVSRIKFVHSNSWLCHDDLDSAFDEGMKDVEFGNKMETVEYCAFFNCISLRSITIPYITSIGKWAFSDFLLWRMRSSVKDLTKLLEQVHLMVAAHSDASTSHWKTICLHSVNMSRVITSSIVVMICQQLIWLLPHCTSRAGGMKWMKKSTESIEFFLLWILVKVMQSDNGYNQFSAKSSTTNLSTTDYWRRPQCYCSSTPLNIVEILKYVWWASKGEIIYLVTPSVHALQSASAHSLTINLTNMSTVLETTKLCLCPSKYQYSVSQIAPQCYWNLPYGRPIFLGQKKQMRRQK